MSLDVIVHSYNEEVSNNVLYLQITEQTTTGTRFTNDFPSKLKFDRNFISLKSNFCSCHRYICKDMMARIRILQNLSGPFY